MNVIEGAGRMQRAGRWMVLISMSVFVLFVCLSEVFVYLRIGEYLNGFGMFHLLLSLLFLIAVPGAVLWLAGWILEGFAKDTH
jgi:hypothetical protein